MTEVYIITCLVWTLLYSLNTSGIRIFTFTEQQVVSENIIGFVTTDFIGKEDLLIFCYLIVIFLIGLSFSLLFKIEKGGVSDKKKKVIYNWFKSYFLLISLSSLFSFIALVFILINKKNLFL